MSNATNLISVLTNKNSIDYHLQDFMHHLNCNSMAFLYFHSGTIIANSGTLTINVLMRNGHKTLDERRELLPSHQSDFGRLLQKRNVRDRKSQLRCNIKSSNGIENEVEPSGSE